MLICGGEHIVAKKNKQKQASQDTEFAADNAASNVANRIAQKNANQQNR